MKCKNCDEEMILEEYYTDFLNNDEEICLREYFGCVECNLVAIKRSYYKKVAEEVTYNEMP